MSCMPKFGRLWAIDFCNQLFPRHAPAYDDRPLDLPAQDRAPTLKRVIPAVPAFVGEIAAGGHQSHARRSSFRKSHRPHRISQ